MLHRSQVQLGTLVKIGRGLLNVTESASNSLLESLQNHGYCYVQHPFIQKSILEQLHRDCRIFFEQYILQNGSDHHSGGESSGSSSSSISSTSSQQQSSAHKHSPGNGIHMPPSDISSFSRLGQRGGPTLVGRDNAHRYKCSPLTPYELESIRAPHGFRGYYRYVGASGLDDAIDCFSIGRDDLADPSVLRRSYFEANGWEEQEYLPIISRRNPWDILLNHVNVVDAKREGGRLHNPHNNNDNFMSDFRDMMVAYYEMCYSVTIDVLRHISCGLGIRPTIPQGGGRANTSTDEEFDLDYFTPFHSKRDCDLQAKYYPRLGEAETVMAHGGVQLQNLQSAQNPGGVKMLRRKGAKAKPFIPSSPQEAGEPVVRLDSHKDLSTITLLSQDALGGLEVWDTDKKEYLEVPVLEDALLVNAGLFLERWTGGLIEATPHRVRSNPKGNHRCSIVFFGLPDHDARIEPLLQQGDNPVLDGEDAFYAGDMMPVH